MRYISSERWVWLLLLSATLVSLASFMLFVRLYPFPVVSPADLAQYLPWVATRSYANSSYKYWWILAFAYVPSVSLLIWKLLTKITHIHIIPRAKLLIKPEKIWHLGTLEITLITLGLILILFNFSYALFYSFFYNYHHLDFIAWPINDILNGKYLLIDTKAQYGFLNILFASLLFKLNVYFSHPNLQLISMTLELISYTCIYILLRGLTRNRAWAVIGTMFTLALHFYGVFPTLFPSEIYVWPGGSAWRFFPAIPTILLTFLWHQSRRKLYFYLSQMAVALGLFWNIEMGISLLIGYLAYVGLFNYYEKSSWKQVFTRIYRDLLPLGFFILAIILGYSLYTWIVIRKLPDWSFLFYYVSLFNNGFLQYPSRSVIPNPANLFGSVAPITGYLFIILIAITRKYFVRSLPVRDLPILVFLATYGYGIYRYFIANQVPSNLSTVIVPATIIATYGMYVATTWIASQRSARGIHVVIVYCIAISLYGSAIFRFFYWQHKLYIQRNSSFFVMTKEPSVNYPPKNRIIALESSAVLTIPIRDLIATAEGIQRYTPNGERVAILADFDHELLVQAERVNIVDQGEMHVAIYTYAEIEKIVSVYRTEPAYLFVEKRMLQEAATYLHDPANYGQSSVVTIFSQIRDQYQFVEELPMAYVYRHI